VRCPSTASKYLSNLARSWPPSVSPNSLDHGLQVYLQTRSITASKCISKLARSRPPSVSPDSLDYGLQVRTIMASMCISKLARSQPPSASLSSLDLSLKVHLQTRSITASKCISEFMITASKCISNTLDQLYLQGATAVVRRYRGNGGGQGDGEYIFGRPQPVQI